MFRFALIVTVGLFSACLGELAIAQLQPVDTPPKTTADAQPLIGKVINPKQKRDKTPAVDVIELQKVVFVDEKGQEFEVVNDANSKMFFKDGRLRNRPVRIMAVPPAPGQPLTIQRVETLVDGQAFDIDYWCEKCKLSYLEPGICICCGAQVELRELPSETPPPSQASL